METTEVKETREAKLERLGFKKASHEIKELKTKQRKLAIAYEHFRFVRKEKIEEFNKKLKEKTLSEKGWDESYDTLSFKDISSYEKTPPDNVLNSLEEAQNKKCFDSFEVAYIEKVKDPILFGRINGCTDRFFIDQWDDDVKIEDILKDNEG